MYTNAGSQCHSQIFSERRCDFSLTAKYGHAVQWPRIRFDASTPKARTTRRVELVAETNIWKMLTIIALQVEAVRTLWLTVICAAEMFCRSVHNSCALTPS